MGKSKKCAWTRQEAVVACITVDVVDGFTLCAKIVVTCPPRPLSQVAFARNPEVLGLRVTTRSDRKRLFARQGLIDTPLERGCETGKYSVLPISICYIRTRGGIDHLLSRDHECSVRPTLTQLLKISPRPRYIQRQ